MNTNNLKIDGDIRISEPTIVIPQELKALFDWQNDVIKSLKKQLEKCKSQRDAYHWLYVQYAPYSFKTISIEELDKELDEL